MPGSDPVPSQPSLTVWRAALVLGAAAACTAGVLLVGANRTSSLGGPIGDGSGAARTRGWLRTTGVHAPEYDASSGRQFSWTGSRARLVVAELDRTQAYQFTLRLNAGRGPALPPPPVVAISVDGGTALPAQTSNTSGDIDVSIPAGQAGRLVVAIDVPNTFVPGPGDTRTLGVIIERVTLTPEKGFRPTWRVVATAAGASVALAAAALLCGLTFPWAIVAAVIVSSVLGVLLLVDGAFLGTTADAMLSIGVGALATGAVVSIARRLWPGTERGLDWGLAAAVTLLAVALKLSLYVHPQASVGDGIFHAHRAQAVHAGNYYFTSITPRPFYEFPYPVALYVNALPFWRWFPTELDLLHLLRGIAIAADGLVGLALFLPLRRWLGRPTAVAFLALWPFVPIPAQALTAANLTNVYGQGVFGLAMAVVLWMAVAGRATVAAIVALTALVALAFLSHFSTASVGVPVISAVVVVLVTAGMQSQRRVGLGIAVALLTAAAATYAAYYSHFHETYATTWGRIVAREGANEARSLAAPISVKAVRWWQETGLNFGWPLLALAVLGLVWLLTRHRRAAPTRVLLAWALVWTAFSVLGVVTPIEMRANLAAAPLVVALAAVALGAVGDRSAMWAAAALTLGAALVWRGASVLASALG